MSHEKFDRIEIPTYTKGEDRFNSVSHIVGGGMGILATILCVAVAAMHHNVYGIVSGAVFGLSMIALYCMSSIYHGLRHDCFAKKVFRVLDHCAIFILIAGTYTPFCLCTIRSVNPTMGWVLFGIVWGLALLGIFLKVWNLKKTGKVSMVLYLGIGWCIVFSGSTILTALGVGGISLLVGGGIAYTVGAAFYGIGGKRRYMHSVFHVFILLGSLLHFLCILLYAM